MRCVRLLVLLGGILLHVCAANAAGKPSEKSSYFPLANGDSWTYSLYSNILDSVLRIDTIRVDGASHKNGKSYYHLTTPWSPLGSVWMCPDAVGDLYWCDEPGQTEHPLLLFSAGPGEGWLLGGRHCMDSAIRLSCSLGSLGLATPNAEISCFKGAWRPGDCYDARWLGVLQKDVGPIYWILAGAGGASLEWTLIAFQPGPPCDCKCHADPLCDGALDVLDLTIAIDVAFCGMTPPTDHGCWCYAHAMNGRTDVDCSGATDIIDISKIADVIFGGADPAREFCDPSEL